MSEANGVAAPETLVRRPALQTYRPYVLGAAWAQDLLDGQPIFTWRWLESMRRDPQVQFGLRILRAPLAQIKLKVKAKDPAVGKFVYEQWRRIWRRSLAQIARSFEAGFAAAEPCYKLEGRMAVFDRLISIHFRDAQPLEYRRGKNRGMFAGVQVNQAGHTGVVQLFPPYAFWACADPDYDRLWGHSRLRYAFTPWREKRGRHGAVDSRRLFYAKCAYTGGQMRYPFGTTDLGTPGSPDVVSNQDIAREILEKFENGGIMCLPNSRDPVTKEFIWIYEPAKFTGEGGKDLIEYPKELDREILKGLGIPPELVEAATVGSGYSGRAIPAQVFFASLDEAANQFIEAIDRQILRWLVRVNFGKGQRYEIEHESLAELVAREPEKAGQMGAGDKFPEDPLSQTMTAAKGEPVRMSMDDVGKWLKIRTKAAKLAERKYPELGGWVRNDAGKWERESMPVRLSAEHASKGGRWITIGARTGEEGKKRGGSPVYVKDGKITKGHPSLTGKKISALKEEADFTDSTHRKEVNSSKNYERAIWGKKAREELKVKPEELHQLAAEVMAHDKAFKDENRQMLKDAREALDEFGGSHRLLQAFASRSRGPEDAAAIRGMDEVAEGIANQYPHFFSARNGGLDDQLYEMLVAGNPENMTEDEAYRQAFDQIAYEKEHHGDEPERTDDDDRIPE